MLTFIENEPSARRRASGDDEELVRDMIARLLALRQRSAGRATVLIDGTLLALRQLAGELAATA